MANKEYLRVAKEVMENKLGFAPALNNIVLLETQYFMYKPSYILFRVRGVKNVNYIVRLNDYYKYDLEIIKVDVENDHFMDEIHL